MVVVNIAVNIVKCFIWCKTT